MQAIGLFFRKETLMNVVWGIIGAIGMFLVSNIIEWHVHRYGMHEKWPCRWAYRRHMETHHRERHINEFFASETYNLIESSAIPLLWFICLPVYWLVARYGNLGLGAGVAIGAGVYLFFYEIVHFYIHNPRGHRFQKTKWFLILQELHRVHHQNWRVNLNVVFPLTDWFKGTLSFEELPVDASAKKYNIPQLEGPSSALRYNGE